MTINEKDPCVASTGPLEKITNDANSATADRRRKAQATLTAEFALNGYAVHQMTDGSFMVARWAFSQHCTDFKALLAFARKLGVVA
jgi:hypothetical protein